MLTLAMLQDRLASAGLLPVGAGTHVDTPITSVTPDSRAVAPGAAFVAVRGTEADGHRFIDAAAENGASVVIAEELPSGIATRYPATAFLVARDTRLALAEAAASLAGDPARALKLVGVTGTNGKTTVATLVYQMLTALGVETGLLSTVAYRIGSDTLEATHTTPGPEALHPLLAKMADAGCTHAAMEVSSHALDQRRTHGLPFRIAVFTNLTQDHLDYHPTFDDYLCAKKRLFDGLAPDAIALVNADDPAHEQMVADTFARVITYGERTGSDLHLEVLGEEADGLTLRLGGATRHFRLRGRFNAHNLAAAYGVGKALGFSSETVLDALAETPPIRGRFEAIAFERGTTALVDYAHTPDALANVLASARAGMTNGAKLWVVFGCGGDRDRDKRPQMGRLAEAHADRVVLTSDNPRTEPSEAILDDVAEGFARPAEALREPDRRAAIRLAAARAAPGDLVVVAGKGHETYQVIGSQRFPFDDRAEILAAFPPHHGAALH